MKIPELTPRRRCLVAIACALLSVHSRCIERREDPVSGDVTLVFNADNSDQAATFEGISVCTPETFPPIPVGMGAPPVEIQAHVVFKGSRTARVRFGCDGGQLGPEVTIEYGKGAQDTGCRTRDGRRVLVDVRT